MAKSLRLFITGVVALSAVALLATTLLIPADSAVALSPLTGTTGVMAGTVFWTLVTLFASALPVKMPRGTIVGLSIAPIVAAMTLGGPTVAGWVAAVGTTEIREIRGRIPWYGTLANHAGLVLPAAVGGFVAQGVRGLTFIPALPAEFVATLVGAAAFFALNVYITSALVALRS